MLCVVLYAILSALSLRLCASAFKKMIHEFFMYLDLDKVC